MKTLLAATAASVLALSACGQGDSPKVDTPETPVETSTPMDRIERAQTLMAETYDVKNSAGFSIGSVTIRDTKSGVDVMLDVTSIPEGSHAIHFHENGTCDGPDFKSAGGHYNPAAKPHGFKSEGGPHAGDMKNIEAPASGVVNTMVENERVSLSVRDGYAPLLDANGTALIIHAVADDYETQPTGAAGARIACAVIGGI